MPRIKLLVNLGQKDAKALGLDTDDAKEGATIDVDQETYDKLIKRGWGNDPGSDKSDASAKPAPQPPTDTTKNIKNTPEPTGK